MASAASDGVAWSAATVTLVMAALLWLPATHAQGPAPSDDGSPALAGRAENLTANRIEAERATVEWDVVEPCGPEVTSAVVYEAVGMPSRRAEAQGRGAGHRSVVLRGLEPESDYSVHVMVEGGCGTAFASPAVTFATPSRPPWKAAALASVTLLAAAGLVWFARRRV